MVVASHEVEIVDQRLHGGIEPVTLAKLQCQALGKVAGADTGRLQPLDDRKRLADLFDGCPEPLGDNGDISPQIAGIVDLVDERLADQPHRRIVDRQPELIRQMVGKGFLFRDKGFEVVVLAAHRLARGRRRPGFGGQDRRRLAVRRSVVVGEDVLKVGIELAGDRVRVGLEPGFEPFPVFLAAGLRPVFDRSSSAGASAPPSSPSTRSSSGLRSSSAST